MSSLWNGPGNGFNALENSPVGTPKMWMVYTLVIIFITIVVNMLRQKELFIWEWIRTLWPKKQLARMNAYRFWAPSTIYTNLTIPAKDRIPDFPNTTYSMSLEINLLETRNFRIYGDTPYRHIVHRGSNELATTTVGGVIMSGGCGGATMYNGQLPPFGLPKRMNPGIFLDPNLNDILVFVDTIYAGKPLRESLRIVDIPLKKPFYLFVVLNKNVLEVYMNCRLEATKVLDGEPRSVENEWYGLAGAASATAQIQNMYLWASALGAQDIRPQCPSPLKFDTERPACGAAETPLPKPAPDRSQIALGFGNTLKTCVR
jgi:hypothetical protein